MGQMQLNQSCFSLCRPQKLQCVETLGQRGSSSFGQLGSALAVSNQGLMQSRLALVGLYLIYF